MRVEDHLGREAAVVVGASVLGALAIATHPGSSGPEAMLPVAQAMSATLVLVAAVVHYFHWRLLRAEGEGNATARLTGWLTVGLILGSTHGLAVAVTSDTSWQLAEPRWPRGVLILALVLLCGLALLAERTDVPGDPAVLGGAAAVALVALNSLILRLAPPAPTGDVTVAALCSAALLAGAVLIWVLLHRRAVPLAVRNHLAAAVALLTVAECVGTLDRPSALLSSMAVAAQFAGALAVCTMTLRMVRRSMLASREQVGRLQHALAEARAAMGQERELLHEVGATLAGISTASQVMRQGDSVPAHRRQRLETMLAAELGRLERLMHARACGTTANEDWELDVDAVVEPLVTSHQARGRDVRWYPSGQHAYGNADELAEVVNILLENAARHGGRGVVQLSVTAASEGILVMCSDSGPGVPAELRNRLFEPEVKGAASRGQGLGLAIAHRLVSARHGTIELVDGPRPGATFVARMPERSAVGALDIA